MGNNISHCMVDDGGGDVDGGGGDGGGRTEDAGSSSSLLLLLLSFFFSLQMNVSRFRLTLVQYKHTHTRKCNGKKEKNGRKEILTHDKTRRQR
ncbi:hypothetical protein RDWZM_007814 [Blomia tropicalis]|uniref:Uncharacterized protein n=1 Tax=Blomia tropicalis TaxID=40697 RepID=A0A9Q0M297_BLOTA|nr:hypothetical protein RDWZM_007814 [Blomia tropicalis]